MTPPAHPARVDRYDILRRLGSGSFGHTFLARDTELNRLVALKVLQPRDGDWKAVELFQREAAVLRDLRHPGIPVVHLALEADWEGGRAAMLVMQYVEGESLAELIDDQRLLEPEAVRDMLEQLLDILEYLHGRVPPVLHRDIKPANVIVRPGGVVSLVDFGAVRAVFRAPEESGSTVVGTYGYMPYEQYMGQASPSSDLYALAATVLHLLTGRPPAEFMSEAGRIEVPATLPGGEALRRVLTRMLAPSPADRYRSAAEVRQALGSGTALVPAAPVLPAAAEGAPRALTGDARRLFRRVTYTPWTLMESDRHPDDGTGILDFAIIGFLSVLTAGILPAIFVSRWVGRRRAYKPFFQRGVPAEASVLDVQVEKIEFEAKLARVRYEFHADGQRHIGVWRVHPVVAERWEPGTPIRILYLPDRGYDSAIVSM